jgi:uncharacterized protein (DUF58 family)
MDRSHGVPYADQVAINLLGLMSDSSFISAETVTQLAGLELKARQVVDGALSGLHRSPHRGFSVEFAEHREYVPGDDLRYVDWKVYGKRDRYYLKQFEQETNFVCELLVDVSPSMRYRSSHAEFTKLDYARHLAAALAYLVLRQQDAVGLITFSHELAQSIKPSGQAAHFKQVIHLLESLPGGDADACVAAHPDPQDFDRPLHEVAERIRPRSLVILLSDCFAESDALTAALRHFRHRRHDVSVLQVVDPAEADFPFEEPTLFHDLESPQSEFVDPRGVQAAYRHEFEEFRRRLEAGTRDLGMDYALLRTDAPLEQALSGFLLRRARRSMAGGTHV